VTLDLITLARGSSRSAALPSSSLALSRLPWATLLLAVLVIAVHAASSHSFAFSLHFVSRSAAVPELAWSEPARLFTASFVHQSWSHVTWNLAWLLSAGALIEVALGQAMFLNVVLWSGAFGLLYQLCSLGEASQMIGGSSCMTYGLMGAFLTWRALTPGLFGRYARNPLVFGFFLVLTAAGFASSRSDPNLGHLGGFVGGVGFGLLGLRIPSRWGTRLAALAACLYLASVATVVLRVLRGDPAEVTASMNVLYRSERSAPTLNAASWYWAGRSDGPRAVLEMARESMIEVVEKTPNPGYADTLATLHFRLGDLDQAIELERRLLLRDPPVPNLHLFTSQLARFEHARLVAIGAPSLAQPPLRLRRAGEGWRLESAALPPVAVPPRRALVLHDGRPAGYLEVDVSEHALPVHVPTPTEGSAASEDALAVIPLATLPDSAARPTRLWWMDPEIAALP
jgi:membrane associated rhomboid family serine protease